MKRYQMTDGRNNDAGGLAQQVATFQGSFPRVRGAPRYELAPLLEFCSDFQWRPVAIGIVKILDRNPRSPPIQLSLAADAS
jgi:hypothetical protein